MRTPLKTVIDAVDAGVANVCLAMGDERGALLSFLFHGLFLDQSEMATGAVDPQQGITVEMFRKFVGYFKSQSYQFVSPTKILEGLDTKGKYVLITFDDGYYNNLRALPVMEEFNVPAVFFVSSNHVKYCKSYWWDVVYRELRKLGKATREIGRAVASYKRFTTSEIEAMLRTQYGREVLSPLSDLDRPFGTTELREFANHPLVVLGNHTEDHAILTNYSASEIRQQIQGGQEAIKELTGKTTNIISYPNGACSEEVVKIAFEAGLQLGMVVNAGKNYLPLTKSLRHRMQMKRFTMWGDIGIDLQCRISRSHLSLSRILSGVKATSRVWFPTGSLSQP